MTAEAGNVQIGLLDARRQAGGRPAALDIHHHHRHLGHHAPADRFHFEGNARTAGTRDRDAPGITRAHGHRNRSDFILALDERAAVFGQFAPEQFHHVRPRRDRVTRSKAHACGDEAVAQRLVAVHHDLPAVALAAF